MITDTNTTTIAI